jgi:dihydroorotate dehydrogenase electron transfer subunit
MTPDDPFTSSQKPLTGIVLENRQISGNYFHMSIRTGKEFLATLPGQFLMIRVIGTDSPLLARPMSIYHVKKHRNGALVEFLYRVVGKGTSLFSRLRKADSVGIIGPLGKGFEILPEKRQIVFVAGGMGVAPLSFLAQTYKELPKSVSRDICIYVGAQSKTCHVGIDTLEKTGVVKLSSDDGSCGYRGFVTDLFAQDVDFYNKEEAVVYACGPTSMLKEIKQILRNRHLACQVSMEQRMACGIGACLGCSISIKDGSYRRVCVEGPVFDLEDLEFE